jgi:hypothetical protein
MVKTKNYYSKCQGIRIESYLLRILNNPNYLINSLSLVHKFIIDLDLVTFLLTQRQLLLIK